MTNSYEIIDHEYDVVVVGAVVPKRALARR